MLACTLPLTLTPALVRVPPTPPPDTHRSCTPVPMTRLCRDSSKDPFFLILQCGPIPPRLLPWDQTRSTSQCRRRPSQLLDHRKGNERRRPAAPATSGWHRHPQCALPTPCRCCLLACAGWGGGGGTEARSQPPRAPRSGWECLRGRGKGGWDPGKPRGPLRPGGPPLRATLEGRDHSKHPRRANRPCHLHGCYEPGLKI